MKRDNINFTKNVLQKLYTDYLMFLQGHNPKITDIEIRSPREDIVIGKDVEIPRGAQFADFIVSKIYELTEEINGDPKELYSMISELVENYSLEGNVLKGKNQAEIKKLYLLNKCVSFMIKEERANKGIPARTDSIYIDAKNDKDIQTIQEVLEDNYIVTTTIYTPQKKCLQKRMRVYDKKATLHISNKTLPYGIYYPDLLREIEVIKTDKGVKLYDYEVFDDEYKNKNCVGIYELETEKSMNDVAIRYVKQLELEKLVEETIDFQKYKIKGKQQ